jgi:hypothetical protein
MDAMPVAPKDEGTTLLWTHACAQRSLWAVATLGRTKKLKLALTVGSMVAGRKGANGMLGQGIELFRDSPEFERIRGQLAGAGRSAALSAAAGSLGRFTDRIEAGNGKKAGSDDEDDHEDDDRADDEYDDDPGEDEGDAAEAGTPRKSTARKSAPRKTATKKSTARKAPAKTSTARKAPAKKSSARRAPAKKSTAKKAPAKKSTPRKSTAKKTPAKKSTPRKSTAKKASARKSTGGRNG